MKKNMKKNFHELIHKLTCFMLCFAIALPIFVTRADAGAAAPEGGAGGSGPGFITAPNAADAEAGYVSFEAFSVTTPAPPGFANWMAYVNSRRSAITLPNRRLTVDERNDWIAEYHALGGLTAFEVETIRLVNEVRLERGLNELAVDMLLAYSARFYSQTKANLNTGGGHFRGPYGGSWRTIMAFGDGHQIWLRGGNGAGGQVTPWELVNGRHGWMNSRGHRNNILRPQFTRIGAGSHIGGRWGVMHYKPMCSGEPVTPLPYDDVAVHLDYHALLWNRIRLVNTDQNHVIGKLDLPTSGVNGTTITWSSSSPAAISMDGTVTRGAADETVVLTATVSRGAESRTREITVTVAAQTTCTIVSATNHPYAFINLTAETIHVPFTITEFSTNGGQRWRRGALPRNTASMFNRGLHLSVQGFAPGGVLTEINFPAINPRPRTNTERLRPWYSADTWTLRARPTSDNSLASPPAAPAVSYEWVHGNPANGRIPVNPQWELLPDGFSFDITPPLERGVRNTHFFRNAPIAENGEYTPASRHFRIRPAAFRRPLRLAVNYNTETIRTRIGQEYSVDGGITWLPSPTEVVNYRTRAVPLDVSQEISSGTAIYLRVETNGRRTRTDAQIINPQPRAEIAAPIALPVASGRIDTQALRPYSALIDGRWRTVPRITAAHVTDGVATLEIRLNPTARRNSHAPGGWTGAAASEPGTLTAHWGVIGTNSRGNIYGVTEAWITPAGVSAPSAQ
ncbi:MAG: CAP domain-containing protein [Defluviitaleaceae bacterium]|nr:CAP domain-containing protein [Defluviitaleaceae bacterium]